MHPFSRNNCWTVWTFFNDDVDNPKMSWSAWDNIRLIELTPLFYDLVMDGRKQSQTVLTELAQDWWQPVHELVVFLWEWMLCDNEGGECSAVWVTAAMYEQSPESLRTVWELLTYHSETGQGCCLGAAIGFFHGYSWFHSMSVWSTNLSVTSEYTYNRKLFTNIGDLSRP